MTFSTILSVIYLPLPLSNALPPSYGLPIFPIPPSKHLCPTILLSEEPCPLPLPWFLFTFLVSAVTPSYIYRFRAEAQGTSEEGEKDCKGQWSCIFCR